jgi:uncharacterized OB-fold protein
VNDLPFNDHSYEQFLNEEKLMGSKCRRCGALAIPPRPICITCLGNQMEWVQFGGSGKLVAFTDIFVPPLPMAKLGFGKNNPYAVGVVELEESPKIVARITGVDAKKPEQIKVNTLLKAEFLHTRQGAEQKTILAFKP